jgi:hypothetical protein
LAGLAAPKRKRKRVAETEAFFLYALTSVKVR